MPLSKTKQATLEAQLPPATETMTRIRGYMQAAGLSAEAFGKLINYGGSTVRGFLAGTYTTTSGVARSDVMFRHAAEDYMSRHRLTYASSFRHSRLYETENVAELRRWFRHCHEHRALAFVYGPPGSQKTFVLEHLIAEFNRAELSAARNRAYYVRASINIQPRDLISKLCVESGAHVAATMQRCMSSLRGQLRDTKTVIVLDEAQLCGIAALEALRELHDTEPRFGILLAGSHGLKQFFDTRAAELEQWNSRLDAGVELKGVSNDSARAIISLELPGLDPDQVNGLVEGCRIADIYSRDNNRKYLSMRRLFKSIAAIKQLDHEAEEATA